MRFAPLAVVCALAAPAAAEGDRALSVGLGWATFSTPGKATGNMIPPAIGPDFGGALSVIYEQSLGSDFSLRGEAAGGLFYGGAGKGQSDTSYAALADVGLTFRFDVLKYVPYAFGGIGVLGSTGGPLDKNLNRSAFDALKDDVVLAIGGGLDVLTSRSRSWGFEGRLASFGGDTTIFTLSVRGTTRWGYF